jgi:hypothetical protein
MSNKDMRHAFQQGVSWTKARVWTNQSVSYEDRAKAALEHYPKKVITRSRVVQVGDYEYSVLSGIVMIRAVGGRAFAPLGFTIDDITALGELVANPLETVEVDE